MRLSIEHFCAIDCVPKRRRAVKREALVRALRRYARAHGLPFDVDTGSGKGSHYRLRLGDCVTTIQSGELSPFHVRRICQQLQLNPADI